MNFSIKRHRAVYLSQYISIYIYIFINILYIYISISSTYTAWLTYTYYVIYESDSNEGFPLRSASSGLSSAAMRDEGRR